MEQTYWINVRDKPAFLSRLMRELSSDDSQILFEGDLSECEFQSIGKLNLSGELFVCDARAPFVVLPLREKFIKPILNQVLPYGRVVHKITHIQIQRNDAIQLLVGDNFHNECISVGPDVKLPFLESLKDAGIVRSFLSDEEARKRYSRK